MKIASPSDRSALTRLWSTCFGDPVDVVDAFWTALWTDITVFVNEDLTAMVTAMPVHWQDKPAAYLYAVATAPEARGRGYCRRLMAEAEEYLLSQGYAYTILSPAKPDLFSFYEKLGYATFFYSKHQTFTADEAILPVRAVTPAEYAALRLALIPETVQYPLPLLAWQASMGELLAIGSDGCAVVEKSGAGFTIKELLASDPQLCADALCEHLQVTELTVRMPGDQPFAMAKSLDGSPLCSSYLGLAFE